jgi:hypothetical protein
MPVNVPINARIGLKPDEALPEPIRFALEPVYDAIQQILASFQSLVGTGQYSPQADWPNLTPDITVFPQFHNRLYVIAGEAIAYGAMVSLYSNAGVLTARNANATDNTKPCIGFCSNIGGIANGTVGEIILMRGLMATNGLTVGQLYWLSTSNGQITATRPVAAGNIEQFIGIALSTTLLLTNIGGYIQH